MTRPTAVNDEFLGPEIAEMFRRSGGEGPLAQRLWHEFEVHDEDLLAEKTAASAFFPGRSPLPAMLESRGITTVLITGTVRDASTLGYRVIMVADANSARRDQDHNATLYTVYRTFGDVRPTTEVLKLIESGLARTPTAPAPPDAPRSSADPAPCAGRTRSVEGAETMSRLVQLGRHL